MGKPVQAIETSRLAPALVLMAAAYLLFAATFRSPWLMDDFAVIVRNPAILSLDSFFKHSQFLRPLRELSLMLDYKLFGFEPAGYHIQQIFWHGLDAILLFVLAGRIGLERRVAWMAALLFLVHPVHVEVLANVSHRKDNIALAFALMSLLAYQRSFRAETLRIRCAWWLTTALCMLLGFLAKGNIVVMPLVLWLFETAFVPRQRQVLGRMNRLAPVIAVAALVALAAWYSHIWNQWAFRKIIVGAMLKMDSYTQFSQEHYLLMVLKSFAFMLSKLFWPVNLSMEYTYPAPAGWFDPWVMAAVIALVAAAVGMFRWYKTSKPLFFALGWMLIFWLPTSNIVWYLSYFAADRYLYTPSVGFCLVLAVSLDAARRRWPGVRQVPALVLVAALAILTWRQTLVWNDPIQFYKHMLQVSPNTQVGLIGLSNRYLTDKEYDQALAVLAPVLRGDPLHVDAGIWNQAGTVYLEKGEYEQAATYFRKALEKNGGTVVEYFDNLGSALEHAGRLAEAEQVARNAIALSPSHAMAHYNLGVSLYRQGRREAALTSFATASRLNPDDADALFNLSVTLLETGQRTAAGGNLARLRTLDVQRATEFEKMLNDKN